jgi:hypothetical protein
LCITQSLGFGYLSPCLHWALFRWDWAEDLQAVCDQSIENDFTTNSSIKVQLRLKGSKAQRI